MLVLALDVVLVLALDVVFVLALVMFILSCMPLCWSQFYLRIYLTTEITMFTEVYPMNAFIGKIGFSDCLCN